MAKRLHGVALEALLVEKDLHIPGRNLLQFAASKGRNEVRAPVGLISMPRGSFLVRHPVRLDGCVDEIALSKLHNQRYQCPCKMWALTPQSCERNGYGLTFLYCHGFGILLEQQIKDSADRFDSS